MRVVILGAGPIGLLAAHFLGGYCVAEKSGGVGIRAWAPTFLWRTPATVRLLRDLDIKFERRDVLVGNISPRGIVIGTTEDERSNYYRRSRGISSLDPVFLTAAVMSSGRMCLETFDVSVDDLVEKLSIVSAIEIRPALVTRISSRRRGSIVVELADGSSITTDRLINTFPAHVFDRLLGRDTRCYEALEKVFVRGVDRFGLYAARRKGVAYLYVTDPELEFDRVNLLPDSAAVYEFNSREPSDEFLKLVDGEIVARGRFQIKGATRPRFDEIAGIEHVGRFARWDHSIRIHDVVEELDEG